MDKVQKKKNKASINDEESQLKKKKLRFQDDWMNVYIWNKFLSFGWIYRFFCVYISREDSDSIIIVKMEET